MMDFIATSLKQQADDKMYLAAGGYVAIAKITLFSVTDSLIESLFIGEGTDIRKDFV